MDPELLTGVVGVIGALLGAVVGAVASYWASVSLQKRARRARAAIRRKAKLYTPLRAELVQLRDRLDDPDTYASAIQTEGEVWRTVRTRPHFTLWSEMRADGRSVSVAPSIATAVDLAVAEIELFNQTLEDAHAVVDGVGRSAYRAVTGQDLMLMNWASSGGADAVLKNRHDLEFFYEERPKRLEEEAAIREIITSNEDVRRAREMMMTADNALRARLDEAANTIEEAMERIARKYEHEAPED